MGPFVSSFLADACALIDFYTGAPSFPPHLRALFEDRAPSIAVTATTTWEIAIKTALGKLVDIRDPEFGTLADMLSAEGYVLLPFDHATAEQAARLPLRHKDPFDRALVATAQRTGRTVLTWDPSIALYGVPVRW
jgi:PIN domain nuclease of toxin-antitoxin system